MNRIDITLEKFDYAIALLRETIDELAQEIMTLEEQLMKREGNQ